MNRFNSVIRLSAAISVCFLFFGLSSANAQTEQEYIDQGEGQLSLKTVQGITDAYDTFTVAQGTFSNNAVINFYLAMTRLLNFAVANESEEANVLRNLLSDYGFEMTGTDEETLQINPLEEDEDGNPVIPGEAPTGERIRSFIADSFIDVIDASVANLDTAVSSWTETDKHIISQSILDTDADIELDYGDLYFLRAGLKLLRMNLLIATAYDLDLNVSDLVYQENNGLLNIQDTLDSYGNLLNLVGDGSQLDEAKASLSGFIDDYLAASYYMRNDPGTEDGAEEMFEINVCDLRAEEFFRTNLQAISDHLEDPESEYYEYSDTIETWQINVDIGEQLEARLKKNRSTGEWRDATCGGSFCGGDVECITINGYDISFTLSGDSGGEVEISGTLNEEGNGMTGTYDGWVEGMNITGNFTASLIETAPEIRHINMNAFFGNKDNLRDFLPEFNICNDPIAGTVGSGLGETPDPTLGGLLPDQTQEDYGLDSNSNSISGTVLDINYNPVEGLMVEVTSAACGGDFLGSGETDENGEYHICGLSEGAGVYIHVNGSSSGYYYIDEWYNESEGFTTDCNLADPLTVIAGDISSIDFQLTGTRGSISGYVHESDGGEPIAGIRVAAINFVNIDGWCNQNYAGEGITDADGAYTIENLPEGSYFVLANAGGVSGPNAQYVPEWYNNIWPEGPGSCEPAPPVDVYVDYDTQLDDFQLDRNGYIAGNVTAGGNPAANVRVTAILVSCGESVMVDAYNGTTDESGNYTIYTPPGSYFLKAGGASSGTNYAIQWYEGVRPVACDTLLPNITVALGEEILADFALEAGGSISGTVVGSDGTTPLANVSVFATANPMEELWYINQRSAFTNAQGQYTLYGFPAGDYYVQANVQGTQWSGPPYYYTSEWYDNAADFSEADQVTLSAGGTATLNDIQLASTVGSISGTVLDADTLLPISGMQVGAHTEPCGGMYVGTAVSGADGTYTITGLPEGTYYLSTWGSDTESGTANYINQWYGGYTISSCSSAEAVAVTEGDVTSGKDFYLIQGGSIWGVVYSSGGTPLSYKSIWAYSEPCEGGEFLGAANTNQLGQYLLVGMPEGPVYLKVTGSPGYVDEWYNDAYVCTSADAFTVNLGSTAFNDFYLSEDGDGDGMADSWEGAYSVTNSWEDPDNDNLSNLEEFQNNTNPKVPDTDDDGVNDGYEVQYGTDPNDPGDYPATVISGTVRDSNGVPITGVSLKVMAYRTLSSCMLPAGADVQASAWSDPDTGEYSITLAMDGNYNVRVADNAGTEYVLETWNGDVDDPSSWDCVEGDYILVAYGETAADIDFELELGGAVSGQVTDGTNGIPGVSVDAYATIPDNCILFSQRYLGGAVTDSEGNYTIHGLPFLEESVYIKTGADPVTVGNYVHEWYGGVFFYDCAGATPVAVPSSGINFALDQAETITGRVTDSEGAGIADYLVYVYVGQCMLPGPATVTTGADGYYTVYGMPSGETFYMRTDTPPMFVGNYINEWYGGAYAYTCEGAVPVVVGPETSKNIDFELEDGHTITGRVIDSDTGLGISGTGVQAIADQCDSQAVRSAVTDADGYYALTGLPLGESFYVRTSMSGMPGNNYLHEWYNEVPEIDCAQAAQVTVVAAGIDFHLDPDVDYDEMSDLWENDYFLNLSQESWTDYDGDMLSNLFEFRYGIDPTNDDTDNDDLNDYTEIFISGTDPNKPDTDDDGMPDKWEVDNNLNPLIDDAGDDPDEDNYTNFEEYLKGTDPGDPTSHPVKAMPWLPLLLE